MSNQGCKDGYKTKILAYLKENTNSKNKASILKIRDAIYQEENGYDPLEKEREKIFDKNEEENPASKEYDGKKKNHDTSSFRTIKKNVRISDFIEGTNISVFSELAKPPVDYLNNFLLLCTSILDFSAAWSIKGILSGRCPTWLR